MARIVEIRSAGPGPFHAPRQPPGHGQKPAGFRYFFNSIKVR